MKRSMLLVLCMGAVTNISAGESTAWISSASLTNPRILGFAALAGLGAYALYRFAVNAIYQQEERIIFDREDELENIEITKKDHALICNLIEAMEQDLSVFEVQPNSVKSLDLDDFDDPEMAKGCEGMRTFFCSIYEQCIQEPDNKAFLEEVVTIFKQTIVEKTIIA